MKRLLIAAASKIVDLAGLVLTPGAAALAGLQTRFGPRRLPMSYAVWDRFGLTPMRHHYYQPAFNVNKIPAEAWTKQDPLLGIDMRLEEQVSLLGQFNCANELLKFPRRKPMLGLEYHYENESFKSGDSEILYSMIRHFRPNKIVEIGSGFSTRMAKAALDQNRKEGDDPVHICIEPFEMPWLEKLKNTDVVRSLVEDVDPEIFRNLKENDILFIDSSHVLRMGGDVYVEYLKILPILPSGVIVHIHDIYWPFDYPREVVQARRYFWNEQYLLQAFLAFNRDFEVLLALNYLAEHRNEVLKKACPVYAQETGRVPGSFWMRRV